MTVPFVPGPITWTGVAFGGAVMALALAVLAVVLGILAKVETARLLEVARGLEAELEALRRRREFRTTARGGRRARHG